MNNLTRFKGVPGFALPWEKLRNELSFEDQDALGCPDEMLPDDFFPYRHLTDGQIRHGVRDWIPSDLLPTVSDIIRNLREPVNLCDIRMVRRRKPGEPDNYHRYIGKLGKRHYFLKWPGRL